MTTHKEVMQQALKALETCTHGDVSTGHVIHPYHDEKSVECAITALRAALAEPEVIRSEKGTKDGNPVGEPVAWIDGADR